MRQRHTLVRWWMALGLILLLLVNLLPIWLILRQAFSPEAEAAQWPLAWLPESLTAENFNVLLQTQSLIPQLLRSLGVALATTGIALAVGFPAGWATARALRIRRLLPRMALVARILPPLALAVPLTALFIPVGLYDHPLGLGLIAAHLTLGLPVALLLAFATFREVPLELEQAAHVDGCTAWGAFWRVVLPAGRGAMGVAAILVFLLSWDEFGYALLIQLTNRTMPPLIYYYTEFGQLGAASAMAAVMLVPAILVIATLQRLIMGTALTGGIKE